MTVTTNQSPPAVPAQPAGPEGLRIPFLTASFADDLYFYMLLWPVWWLMGIEQILLPFFLGWEFVRGLAQQRLQFTINRTALWALLLALWCLVPLYSLDTEYLDIFFKEIATMFSQFFILFLFWNQVRTAGQWWRIVRGVEVVALYVAVGSMVYISGLWQGETLSLFGRLLPPSLIESSNFFSSVAIRAFGGVLPGSGIFTARVSSFSLEFSGLSMIALLLIWFTLWRIEAGRGMWRLINLVTLAGLLVSLAYAESRVAYLAMAAGLALYVTLRLGLLHQRNKPFSIAMGLLAGAILLAAVYFLYAAIADTLQFLIVEWRPGSWLVRFRIYEETLRLLPEHWLAGWGTAVRIPYLSSNYSAGSHSSYLGMLFQHGVVGLALYLLLLVSVWRVLIYQSRRPGKAREAFIFWISMAAGLFAFNLREIADIWWWDQMTAIIVWTIWGLIVTGSRAFAAQGYSPETDTSGGAITNVAHSTTLPVLDHIDNQERT